MNKRSLLAVALTALTFVPVACTIESSKDKETGGAGNGGADEKGGATSTAGTTNKGGATSAGGTTAAAGSNSSAGTTSIAGSTSVAGAAGASVAAAGSSNAGAAGGGGVSATAGAGGATVAGAGNLAGAAGSSSTVLTRVDVSANISAPTTWKAGSVYVIAAGDTVYVDSALTIEAGVVVKFGANARLYVQAEGTLNAVATATAPIVFTGIKDDSAGGDTNGDGSATKPTLGDWGSIDVYGNGSALDFVVVRYSNDGVILKGANQTVKHSTFTYNGQALDASGVSGPANTILTNDTFYKNTLPIVVNGGTPVDTTNVFHDPALATDVNTFQGIFVESTPRNSVVWSNTEVAYVLPEDNASYYVSSPAALTLSAGVVVKVGTGSAIIVASGATLNGSATATFTSLKDDIKGDSNGDGTATTAAAGDWDGVRVITPTSDDWLTGASILYATN